MVPVAVLIERPEGALYIPTVNIPVPVKVTVCDVARLTQNGLPL